ncbi:hypothetical protein C8A05DRAFT_14062 [Staphylotrichum tortipilum]|uniref:Uncharacterized protein n=1 Tax=Staphylotrichum tortipilum TaxID=2831512 RepID=A0AAN6MPI2_9PEZI|nr:hypothetical protein C8A05DRAFT_14062 [Staphylotrichum longicolle]
MGDLVGSAGSGQPVAVEGRSMAILYGSETGSAEDIAIELGKMTERLRFQTTVDEMDGFKLADVLHASLVIFVTSTTGQGDMPKNTLKFWKNLRREKLNNTNCLGSMRFAIFGLGDSSYLKFNWAARKLRARLMQLGATEFFRAGEGDERHDNGIDSIYLPWSQELKSRLLTNFPLPPPLAPIPDDVPLPPKYSIELLPKILDHPTPAATPSLPDGDHNDGDDGDDDAERRFQASKTKSAARSHIDHPKPGKEQARQDWERLKATFPAHLARQDPAFERVNPRGFNTLDKDNILKDHPEKYLLKPPTDQPSNLPPQGLLPIPNTFVGTLTHHERVTPPNHWQDVRHLRFEVPVGDAMADISRGVGHLTMSIWPKNYPEDVDDLIGQMGWEEVADKPLQLKGRAPTGLYAHNRVASLRQLLTHNLDITAVPKRSFIRELIFFTEDEREKERLQELTLPGNEQEFYDYTCRPRRTILELLRDFKNVKVPFGRVLDLFPIIRPRDFSVCNGGSSFKGAVKNDAIIVEILAALVEYKTIIRKPRQGLCSRYIKHLPTGARLAVRLKMSSGPRLVPNMTWAARPLIAIATGTGIAPIRAILQERDSYENPGEAVLFFGCRNRAADFHFEKEWGTYEGAVNVFPAFSRDRIEPDPRTTVSGAAPTDPAVDLSATSAGAVQYDSHKNYVQHLIRKHAQRVGFLMVRRPIVCVCGNAGRMPISVRSALLDALVISKVVGSVGEAEAWLTDPDKVTFWQETW